MHDENNQENQEIKKCSCDAWIYLESTQNIGYSIFHLLLFYISVILCIIYLLFYITLELLFKDLLRS